MNIFIIQGKSGIYPGIWMSRAKAEADREMVACAIVSGDVVEMVPASEVREREEWLNTLVDRLVMRLRAGGVEVAGIEKIDGKWERCK